MNNSKFILCITCTVVFSIAYAAEETYTYTADSLVSSVDGKRSDVSDITLFAYDEQNNLSKITNALGQEVTFSDYMSKGKPRTVVDVNNVITELKYNNRGQLISIERGGRSTGYQYNDFGLLTSTSFPWGDVITFLYDDARRVTQVFSSTNESIKYTYNTKGNISNTRYLNSVGVAVGSFSSSYDDLGRKITDTAGVLNRTYNYDALSNLTGYSTGDNSTAYDFDELSRLIKATDVLAGETTFTYDDNDVLKSVIDASYNITQYSPDFNGDNEKLTSQATGTTKYIMDDAGNIISKTDAKMGVTTFTYDALNRLLLIDNSGVEEDVNFSYDQGQTGRYGVGKLTKIEQLNNSIDFYYNEFYENTKIEIVIESHNYVVLYNYDEGLLTKVVYPSGREVIYTYNTAGLVVNVDSLYQGKLQTLAKDITYLPKGPIESLIYGNDKLLTNTYDTGYFLTSRKVTDIVDYIYNYDGSGNIERIIDNSEVPDIDSVSLSYDLKHRLIAAATNQIDRQFSYDETDNRTTKQVDGIVDNYNYDNSKLTSINSETFIYDNNGNLTHNGSNLFTYNLSNRLSSATTAFGTYQYFYNALGQRIQKKGEGVDVHYVYDQSGQLIHEVDIVTNIITEYVYVNGKRLTIHQGRFSSDEIVGDDSDDNIITVGDWSLVTKGKNIFHGSGYLKSPKGSGENSVTWPLFNATQGKYDVYARWAENRNNASNAPYVVNHALGQDIVNVDQSKTGSSWKLLGSYTLNADSTITMSNNANGNVVADAIKIYPINGATVYTTYNYFIHKNHLDAPVALSDDNGVKVWSASYTPFAKAIVSDDEDGDGVVITYNARTPGQYWDKESGLHYNYFRDYDPELGRYIQSDPIGLAGGINTYGYVGGNPVNAIDPLGLDTVFIWKPGTYTDSSGNSYPSSYGHTSSMSDYGTYLSHHPDKKGLNPAESLFRTYMQDKALYGRDADLIMYVDNPNKLASDKFAKDYLSSEDYWGVFGNCTDATRSTLNAGESAIRNLNVGSDNLVSYPSELERALRDSYWLNRRIIRDVNPFNP
jgi:RHS repeat-associated protein